MRKYYTRACNFYHGRAARSLIKLNKAFPLNGKKDIAFDKIEIFTRKKKSITNNTIHIKDIRKQIAVVPQNSNILSGTIFSQLKINIISPSVILSCEKT